MGGDVATPLYSSLVAFWKLDEASGSRADSVGANTLADNNTVTSATGLLYALASEYVGGNSEFLSIATNAALETGDVDFWMACWYYRTTTNASMLMAKDGDVAGRDYTLDVNTGATGKVRFYIDGGGSGIVSGDDNINSNWNLVVAWHDKTLQTLNIQFNGGTAVGAARGVTPPVSATAFRIGARVYSGAEGYHSGLIGPAMLGKGIVPSATQRTWLYNSGAGRTLAEMQAYTG